MKIETKQMLVPLLVVLLLAAGCSKDDTPGKGNASQGGLRFEVQIENGWRGGSSVDGQTRAPITTTTFPGSAAGTVYQIGLSIVNSSGSAYVTGADHILAELTVKDGEPDAWRYQLRGTTTWLTELPVVGLDQNIRISAYYPYNAATTYSTTYTNVPFDLTVAAQQTDPTDLLFVPLTPAVLNKPHTLVFKHFYSLFEFKVKRQAQTPAVTLTGVSMNNAAGKSWVVNKGAYNARTGLLVSNTAGTVSVTGQSLPLATDSYQTVSMLVPSRTGMNGYTNGDIWMQFDLDGTLLAPFPIQRDWLFANGSAGLTAGMKYSLQLLYDLRPDGTATLTPIAWSTGLEAEMDLGTSPCVVQWDKAPFDVKSGNFNPNGSMYTIDGATTASYNTTQPGVTFYATIDDVLANEDPYARFEVATADEISGIDLSWQEAWDACKAKFPVGHWRLPRQTELMLMYLNRTALEATTGFTSFDGTLPDVHRYWSATEADASTAWSLNFVDGEISAGSQDMRVRCVRELPILP